MEFVSAETFGAAPGRYIKINAQVSNFVQKLVQSLNNLTTLELYLISGITCFMNGKFSNTEVCTFCLPLFFCPN